MHAAAPAVLPAVSFCAVLSARTSPGPPGPDEGCIRFLVIVSYTCNAACHPLSSSLGHAPSLPHPTKYDSDAAAPSIILLAFLHVPSMCSRLSLAANNMGCQHACMSAWSAT